MRSKIDSTVSMATQTSIGNELQEVLGELKGLKKHLQTLNKVNEIQLQAFDQMQGDTDYKGQITRISNEITSLKQQYKEWNDYRVHEDKQFQQQFQALVRAESNRAKIKELLIQNKQSSNRLLQGSRSQSVALMKGQKRILPQVNRQEQLLKQNRTIQKAKDIEVKRFKQKRKGLESQMDQCSKEIEALEIQIRMRTDENADIMDKIKEFKDNH